MRKFAPLALLLGMLSALMLGGVGTAQAAPDGKIDKVVCSNVGNVGVNVVVCDLLDAGVKVGDIKITVNRVLSDNELNVLSNIILKEVVNVKIGDINILNLKNVIIKVLNDIDVKVSDIKICILAVCK